MTIDEFWGGSNIAVTGALITGVTTGTIATPYSFTASYTPINATLPVTYTWSTTNLVSGQGTATAVYQWSAPGTYTISVTIANIIGAATDTHTIIMCQPAIATREAAIRAVLYGLVNGVTNAGTVHDYTRWSVLYPDARTQSDATISGQTLTRVWMLSCVSVLAERLEFRTVGTNNGIAYTYTYKIRGYFGLRDAVDSENDALAVALAVINALHSSETLHDGRTYHNASWAALDVFEPRMFNNQLVHYIEITQTVTEVIACVSYTTALPTWGAGTSALDEAAIRAGLVSVVQAVTDAGNVYDYVRWSVLYPDARAQHEKAIGGQTVVRSWMLTCTNLTAELLQFRRVGSNAGLAYSYVYKLRGYFGLRDPDVTEKRALAIALTVLEALHRSNPLNDNTYLDAGLASLDVFEPRMFVNWLAHYVEITQTVRTVQA